MSNKKSGSSFDLSRARELSEKLAPNRSAAPPKAVPKEGGYIRFSAGSFQSFQKNASEPAPPTPREQFGPGLWNRMLDQCLAAAGAELAFVVDEDGLVVASRGVSDPSVSEGIGARLVVAFEQAAQMAEVGATSQSIAIEFGERWLTGIRMRRGEAHVFTVGVLGPVVVTRETRRAMERILAY